MTQSTDNRDEFSITVLMAFCKSDRPIKLDRAIKSIWASQSLKPDEIVMVQDGPVSSELEAVMRLWRKEIGGKLNLFVLKENVGLGQALNFGLKHCHSRLVARMDSDDEALSTRFEEQVKFFKHHEHLVVLGCQAEFVHSPEISFKSCMPISDPVIKKHAKLRNPFVHPTVMFDRKIINEVGGYPPFRKGQDYALWAKIIQKGFFVANLQTVELRFDFSNDFIDRRGWRHWRHEMRLFRFMYTIDFINELEFFANIFTRTLVRLSPKFLRSYFYLKLHQQK